MNYWERQYNPRVSCPHPERHFDDWRRRAAEARATLSVELNVPYGPHEREQLDLCRADAPRGTLVFLHGGYWRAFCKDDFTWVAPLFVSAGITVAIPSYPLCPAVPLESIVGSIARAMTWLQEKALRPAEKRRVVLVGHSAGAHLAACRMSRLMSRADCAPDAIVCISGVFDLLPLLHTEFLSAMGWTAQQLHAASPIYAPAPEAGRILLAVGAAESREFHTQSERLSQAWSALCAPPLEIAGADHFDALNALREPEQLLARKVIELFD